MAATAIALPYQHEFILPYAGPTVLAGPWTVLRTSSISTVHLFQNTTSGTVTLSTGVAARPTLSVPPGDTILAVTNLSVNRETILVGRIPYAGRRFTTTKWVSAESMSFPPYIDTATYGAGDAFLALGGFRGNCGGNLTGSLRVSWGGGSAGVPGFVQYGDAAGIVTQPLGDQRGNIGAAAASILTSGGTIAVLTGNAATSGGCNTGGGGWRASAHIIIRTEQLEFGERVRSNLREDAGSLFQATQAAAVELGLSEAFEYGESVPAGALRSFREALTPDEVAVSYYALPTRNQEMLVTVEGETNLGRLAGVYPAGIMVPATSIPGAVGGVVTAQQAIQHVTNQWASEHPWLSFAPIPDLRLMVPGAVAAPRQHYIDNPGDGVLTTAAVVIPQEGNERRSMREILDEWLSIFPGTIVRQTSTGVIELVPRVGPDAASGAALALTWGDLTGISDGEDDPSGVTNRCRVTSQGWEFTPNQALIAPSFVLVRAANGVTRAVLDGENVLPTDSREEHSIYDDLVFTGLTAPTAATVDVVIHAYGSWSPTTSSSFSLEGTATRQVTLAAGQAQDVSITHNSRSQNVTATFRLRRSADGGRIAVSAPGGIPESAGNPFGRTWFAYVLDVDVTGTAWVRSNERVESEFGQTGTTLPGAGGGDALADSRALYGERLAVINSNAFQLTNEQAQLVARSYVLANINPRTIRDVQQSEWNRYPVKFDHIGRLVDLPTGERAVVENRAYSDSFSSTHGAMTSSFSASVTEIVIDTSTDWLLLDSGDFFQLDSGDLVEVS